MIVDSCVLHAFTACAQSWSCRAGGGWRSLWTGSPAPQPGRASAGSAPTGTPGCPPSLCTLSQASRIRVLSCSRHALYAGAVSAGLCHLWGIVHAVAVLVAAWGLLVPDSRSHAERKNQVRRHMALIGHPIIGDPQYGYAYASQVCCSGLQAVIVRQPAQQLLVGCTGCSRPLCVCLRRGDSFGAPATWG